MTCGLTGLVFGSEASAGDVTAAGFASSKSACISKSTVQGVEYDLDRSNTRSKPISWLLGFRQSHPLKPMAAHDVSYNKERSTLYFLAV